MNDISSILDATLDDIADLPAFEIFHPGAHRATVHFSEKKIGEHPAVEMKLKLVETMELTDPTQTPQEPGTGASLAYMLDNEFGLGNLKAALKPLGAATGQVQLREIMEAAEGLECMVVISHRKDKNDPDKVYMQLKKIEVL